MTRDITWVNYREHEAKFRSKFARKWKCYVTCHTLSLGYLCLNIDDRETKSCTILDSNDDVILLAAVAYSMRREF